MAKAKHESRRRRWVKKKTRNAKRKGDEVWQKQNTRAEGGGG